MLKRNFREIKKNKIAKRVFLEKKEDFSEEIHKIVAEKSVIEQDVATLQEKEKEILKEKDLSKKEREENERVNRKLEKIIEKQLLEIQKYEKTKERYVLECKKLEEVYDLMQKEVEQTRLMRDTENLDLKIFITAKNQAKARIENEYNRDLKKKNSLEEEINRLRSIEKSINKSIEKKQAEERLLQDGITLKTQEYEHIFHENIKVMKQNKTLNK